MRRVTLLTALTIIAAGCGDDGVTLEASRTLRGHVDRPRPNDVPRDLRAVSARQAFLLFPHGRVLRTTDGGATWRPAPRAPRLHISQRMRVPLPRACRSRDLAVAMAFSAPDDGIAICGGVPGAGQQRKRAFAFDGARWRALPEPPSYGYVGELEPLGAHAYVHHSGRANDLITTDGGRTWRSALPPETSTVGRWVTARVGWALDWSGDVYRTRDGGRHWRHAAPGFWPATETSFCDDHTGFGRGRPKVGGYTEDSTIYRTIDGGRTWTRRSRPGR